MTDAQTHQNQSLGYLANANPTQIVCTAYNAGLPLAIN
jgi:hypothetical protein